MTTNKTILNNIANGRFQIAQITTTTNPPTQAELTAVLGQPTDNSGLIMITVATSTYVVISNGTEWLYISATIAP